MILHGMKIMTTYGIKSLKNGNRVWSSWLTERLSFPFEVERMEDFELNPFQDNDDKAFSVGHIVKVIKIEMEVMGLFLK